MQRNDSDIGEAGFVRPSPDEEKRRSAAARLEERIRVATFWLCLFLTCLILMQLVLTWKAAGERRILLADLYCLQSRVVALESGETSPKVQCTLQWFR